MIHPAMTTQQLFVLLLHKTASHILIVPTRRGYIHQKKWQDLLEQLFNMLQISVWFLRWLVLTLLLYPTFLTSQQHCNFAAAIEQDLKEKSAQILTWQRVVDIRPRRLFWRMGQLDMHGKFSIGDLSNILSRLPEKGLIVESCCGIFQLHNIMTSSKTPFSVSV